MTILAALARRYDRLAAKGEAPPFGYARTAVGFCIILDPQGHPVGAPVDLRDLSGKKPAPRRLDVPAPLTQRTSGISANFLWDKTAYSLGVTAGTGKRTSEEHADFRRMHREALSGTSDEGLMAFLGFLDQWQPDRFENTGWPQEIIDQNVVFALEGEHRRGYLHDRPAARAIWQRIMESQPTVEAVCLTTGGRERIARSHPPIKGVRDAQSSGAFIVSFNATAFTSYGLESGENAQIGEPAAFAYTTALNRLLETGSPRRIQIGDATTVFWAEAEDEENEAAAENVFSAAMMGIDENVQAGKVGAILEGIAKGRPLSQLDPKLAEGVRFYVLGLSPNAARLSVRYWFDDSFGAIADAIARHAADMAIEPPPREERAGVRRLVLETAPFGKYENIPPQLAGELLRAVLTGRRYPATLLATLLMRLRADGGIHDLRVAMLKAIVARNRRLDKKPPPEGKEPPVSLDRTCNEPGYLLGRLFAVYEYAQSSALGRGVNATVKDKFYGAAATTPRAVFPMLDRNSVPHLAKLRKEKPGLAVSVERQVGDIMALLSPGADPFPRSLPPEQQALFALGYYHQRSDHFTKKTETEPQREDA